MGQVQKSSIYKIVKGEERKKCSSCGKYLPFERFSPSGIYLKANCKICRSKNEPSRKEEKVDPYFGIFAD